MAWTARVFGGDFRWGWGGQAQRPHHRCEVRLGDLLKTDLRLPTLEVWSGRLLELLREIPPPPRIQL
eukprot:COSAG01_NODE_976_length_12364_cov_109.353200_6_plen_67_part_00